MKAMNIKMMRMILARGAEIEVVVVVIEIHERGERVNRFSMIADLTDVPKNIEIVYDPQRHSHSPIMALCTSDPAPRLAKYTY